MERHQEPLKARTVENIGSTTPILGNVILIEVGNCDLENIPNKDPNNENRPKIDSNMNKLGPTDGNNNEGQCNLFKFGQV